MSAARMRPEWNYRADKAGKVAPLNADQRAYAITLRRVLAHGLANQAARRALGNLTPAGREWTGIAAACRREVRRMERALAALPGCGGAHG